MKKILTLPAIASMAMVGLFGCSSESAAPIVGGDFTPVSSENGTLMSVSEAKAHLAMFRRSVVDTWQFKSAEEDSASVDIDTTLQNENFAVDADVAVEDDSIYTIASAGVDGEGFAWMVQIENGSVVYSWRENANSEWQKFKTGKAVNKNELSNVRVERAGKVVVVFVNGKIVSAFRNETTAAFKIEGMITFGFDKKDSGKCHCHNGHVEQVGVETIEEIIDTPIDSLEVEEPIEEPVEPFGDSVDVNDSAVVATNWIAEWNFNDSANVGLDVTGNGHDATIGEGSVSSVGGIATFDGRSGFEVI